MKVHKLFSKKYYTEDLKELSKALIRSSSYYGKIVHDSIEGINGENEAYKYGGCACVGFKSDLFEYSISIRRKSKRELSKE